MKSIFLLTVLFGAHQLIAEPIRSRGTMWLGAPANFRKLSATGKTDTGEPLYQYYSSDDFSLYALVTPKSKRIYALWSLETFQNRQEAEDQFSIIEESIKRRYGGSTWRVTRSSLDYSSITEQPDRFAHVRFHLNSDAEYELLTQYVDIHLNTLAERETLNEELDISQDPGKSYIEDYCFTSIPRRAKSQFREVEKNVFDLGKLKTFCSVQHHLSVTQASKIKAKWPLPNWKWIGKGFMVLEKLTNESDSINGLLIGIPEGKSIDRDENRILDADRTLVAFIVNHPQFEEIDVGDEVACWAMATGSKKATGIGDVDLFDHGRSVASPNSANVQQNKREISPPKRKPKPLPLPNP